MFLRTFVVPVIKSENLTLLVVDIISLFGATEVTPFIRRRTSLISANATLALVCAVCATETFEPSPSPVTEPEPVAAAAVPATILTPAKDWYAPILRARA